MVSHPKTTAPARDREPAPWSNCYNFAELELEPEDHRKVVHLVDREAARGLLVVDVDVPRLDEERRPAEAEVEASAAVPADVGLRLHDRLNAVGSGRITGDAVCAGAADEVEATRRPEERDVELQTTAPGVDHDVAHRVAERIHDGRLGHQVVHRDVKTDPEWNAAEVPAEGYRDVPPHVEHVGGLQVSHRHRAAARDAHVEATVAAARDAKILSRPCAVLRSGDGVLTGRVRGRDGILPLTFSDLDRVTPHLLLPGGRVLPVAFRGADGGDGVLAGALGGRDRILIHTRCRACRCRRRCWTVLADRNAARGRRAPRRILLLSSRGRGGSQHQGRGQSDRAAARKQNSHVILSLCVYRDRGPRAGSAGGVPLLAGCHRSYDARAAEEVKRPQGGAPPERLDGREWRRRRSTPSRLR